MAVRQPCFVEKVDIHSQKLNLGCLLMVSILIGSRRGVELVIRVEK